MTTQYHWDLIQGTDEWLRARLGIITASQMSTLITKKGKIADNNDSRMIVFEKVVERITGDIEEHFSNHHMERGNTFEPFARDEYHNNVKQVRECGFITRQFGGFKIGYSPDGVGDDLESGIEIKCPTRIKHVKEICQNHEPSEHIMQMQTGLLVTGWDYIDFVSYFNGLPQRIVTVLPDLELHEKIIEAARVLELNIQKNINLYEVNSKDMHKTKFIEGISI